MLFKSETKTRNEYQKPVSETSPNEHGEPGEKKEEKEREEKRKGRKRRKEGGKGRTRIVSTRKAGQSRACLEPRETQQLQNVIERRVREITGARGQ